ncbi:hypothetical protein ABFV83_19390 [Lacrimispora sp. BS-2]|uniref:Uncharacterized protein n=1 Tax=Lacrimispora sp. BS-2 TaxID=3151850 RepID=A0AAU7PNV3_9FIRM
MKQSINFNKKNWISLKIDLLSLPVLLLQFNLLLKLFSNVIAHCRSMQLYVLKLLNDCADWISETVRSNIQTLKVFYKDFKLKNFHLNINNKDMLRRCGNLLFFMSLSIFFFQNTLGVSVLNLVGDWWRLTLFLKKICVFIAVLKIALDMAACRYDLKEFCVITVISVLQYVIYLKTGNMAMVVLWVFILAAKDVDFDLIIKYSFIINVYLMVFVVTSSLFGIVEDRIYIRANGAYRYSLGYQYTTNIANLYMHMIFMYVYWKKKRISIVSMILLMIVNVLIFRLTDTKNAFAMGCMVLIGAFIIKVSVYFSKPHKWINWVYLCSIPFFAVVSVVVTSFYNKDVSWMNTINNILSGRLKLGYEGIKQYGIGLFGNKIEWVGGGFIYEIENKSYNYVDSSYVQFLLEFGMIALILACIYFIKLNYKAIKRKDVWFGLSMFVIAVHSISDPQLMWLECNPFLLYGLSKSYEMSDGTETSSLMPESWKKVINKCLMIGAFIAALYFSYRICRIIRTWMTMYQFYEVERQKYFILFYIILAGIITCAGINIGKVKIINRLFTAGSILTISIGFCLILYMITEKQTDYQKDIEKGIDLVENIKAQGIRLDSVYVDDIPYCYERKLKNVSVIMGKMPQKGENAIVFTKKGNINQFLYNHQYYGSLLSNKEYVFVSSEELKGEIERQGFDLKRYYDGIESVNLKSLARINRLPIIYLENGKKAIEVNGNEESLIYGPYLTIYKGKLKVTYELTLLDTDVGVGEVAKARISSDYGQNIMTYRSIDKEEFNDKNQLTVSMVQDIGDSANMEFLLFAVGKSKIAISSIIYQIISE